MTFVYQDAVPLTVQRNVIDDINHFLNVIEKILPLENESFELNNLIKQEEKKYYKKTTVMEAFHSDFAKTIETLSKKYNIDPVEQCKDTLNESATNCIYGQRTRLKADLDQFVKHSKNEIALMAENIRSELESFLWFGVYGANRTHLILGSNDKVTGNITFNLNGLSYTYETVYADVPLKIKKFINEISLPVRSKTGLIHKEERITQLDISEYIITRIYDGEDFQLDMKNKKSTKKINITVPGDIKDVSIVYIAEEVCNIMADEHLSSLINLNKIEKLKNLVYEYLKNDKKIISKTLVNVEIDEKDAITNHEIFDCVKIIASSYGEIINEIFDHGFTRQEITIKEIIEDGTRNELFISVDEISSRLSALGGDGLELKDLLNL